MPKKPTVSGLICKAFVERAAAQHMTKGKKRDRACIEFVCGAVAGLVAVLPEKDPAIGAATMAAFLVAVRGYDECARMAAEVDSAL